MSYLALLLYFILIENILLSFGLGADFGLRTNWSLRSLAILMGSVTVVLIAFGSLSWVITSLILTPLGIGGMSLIVLLPGVTGLYAAQTRWIDALPRILRYPRSLAMLVLGFSLLVQYQELTYGGMVIGAVSTALGLGFVNFILHTIKERMRLQRLPSSMAGLPGELITLGLLSLVFSLLDSLVFVPLFM
ncbi:hypothetical protein [Spirochaeta lutea]|uniref:Uncharacterized protein n=1 Tax=Spirochaeta lutea TaxID=1480694 RepID=A0A098QT56_9SPIO|nr:hypothetical protein [Spirochaeta lutea]KGE70746.1 hypothetical protein DC28_14700 [Spirochaeta lutea]